MTWCPARWPPATCRAPAGSARSRTCSRKTVAVVGDGAVALVAVTAARELGAERITAMSRSESRQDLALEFGVTDIVTERGDDGVATVRELTGGLGAHSVIEAVGTQVCTCPPSTYGSPSQPRDSAGGAPAAASTSGAR
jgi:threonine dehydrogenase-like Zn-dependent dehydrogenase